MDSSDVEYPHPQSWRQNYLTFQIPSPWNLHHTSLEGNTFRRSRLEFCHVRPLNNLFLPNPSESSPNPLSYPECYDVYFFLLTILKCELQWEIQRIWSFAKCINACQPMPNLHRLCCSLGGNTAFPNGHCLSQRRTQCTSVK